MNVVPKNNQEVLICVQKYPLIIDFLLTISDLSETRCLMQNRMFCIWKSNIDAMLWLDVVGVESDRLLCCFNKSQAMFLLDNKNKLKEIINFS